MRNWPWAPMLNSPALNARPTARPPRISGVAATSVLTIAVHAAEARPRSRAHRPSSGRSRSNVVDRGRRAAMTRITIAPPTRRASDDRRQRRARRAARTSRAEVRPSPRAAGRGRRRLTPALPRSRRSAGRSCRRSPSAARPRSCRPSGRPRTATIRPRYMTAIRSDSSSTSSSSAETSRIAVPASRFAIAWRWMNSMLPTSRPRVGWSRTSSLRSRPNSRATTTFCWLPPDSVPARTSADGVRMSYSPMRVSAALARSPRRCGRARARTADGSSR